MILITRAKMSSLWRKYSSVGVRVQKRSSVGVKRPISPSQARTWGGCFIPILFLSLRSEENYNWEDLQFKERCMQWRTRRRLIFPPSTEPLLKRQKEVSDELAPFGRRARGRSRGPFPRQPRKQQLRIKISVWNSEIFCLFVCVFHLCKRFEIATIGMNHKRCILQ